MRLTHNPYKPTKQIRVSSYCSRYNLDLIKWSTHFIDAYTGECIKISPQTKLLYEYRYNRYKYCESLGNPYRETNQTVARVLGFSKKSIDEVYGKELRVIGLMEVVKDGAKSYHYLINDLFSVDGVKGWFINHKLEGMRMRDVVGKKQEGKCSKKFSYESLKTLEHNKRVASNIYPNSDYKVIGVDQEVYKDLLKIKQEYEKLRGGE